MFQVCLFENPKVLIAFASLVPRYGFSLFLMFVIKYAAVTESNISN